MSSMAPKMPVAKSQSSGAAETSEENYAAKFMKKRLKEADNSYSYSVRGKMSDGSLTKWSTHYDQTLEYVMYPSLNVLDDEPIAMGKEESRPGSRNRSVRGGSPVRSLTQTSGMTSGGSRASSPAGKLRRSASPGRPSHHHRRGQRSVIGGGSPGRSSPHSMGKRTDALIDEFMSDDEEPQTGDGHEVDEMYGVTKPEMMWEVDVTAVDQLPETEAQKKRRLFQKRVDEIGETYLRKDLRTGYEVERQRKIQQIAEETRESNFRTLKGASSKSRKAQSAMSKVIDEAVPVDRYARRGGATRRDSSRNTGGQNMMEIMNRPEYIYKSLRNAAVKKKVLIGMDIKQENEDDESIYRRQRSGIEEELKNTDRGQGETQFDMEGLLYYRFNYDAQHEAKLLREREEEEARVHTRQGKEIVYSPSKSSRASSRKNNDSASQVDRSIEEEEENKSEYEKLMVQMYKGTRKEPVAATLESDLNSINLGRLRRAINQRLSSLDQDYLLDQRELRALDSPTRGEGESNEGGDEENRGNVTPGKGRSGKKSTRERKGKKEQKGGGLKYPSPSPSRTGSPTNLAPGESSPNTTPISPLRRKKIGGKDDNRKNRSSPLAHISPLRPEGDALDDDAPLHEIRDRALNSYIKSMGLERYKGAAGEAFGIGTTAAMADSVDTKTGESNLVHGMGESSSPSKKIMEEMQVTMSGGLNNQEIQAKTISGKHIGESGAGEGQGQEGSKKASKGVSGSTRVAQDNLLMMQLRAGVVPEQFIRRSNTLSHLDIDIRGYGIGDAQGACLGGAISGLDTLRALILEDNRLTSQSIPIIVRNLNYTMLILLDISCNNAHNAGATAIANYLKEDSVLSELRMNKCCLQDDDMPQICQALRNNKKTSLENFQINSNKIGPEGAKVVAKLLGSLGCIISDLDMSWNNICTDGAMPIANALRECSSMKNINLNACSIDDVGGQSLATCLKFNRSIVNMSLAQNNIAAGSCFVFSKSTLAHPTIMVLDLSRNPVGEAGARSIYRQIMRGLRCYIILRKCTYFYDDKIFNYTTPSLDSPYHLDMDVAYQAAVMQELIFMVMEHPATCRFGHVTYQASNSAGSPVEEYKLSLVNGQVMLRGKKFELPRVGVLNVEFFSSVNMPSMKNKASDRVQMVMQMIIKGADEEDRLDYLRLMAADLYLTCSQVQEVMQYFIENQIIGTGIVRKMDVLACTWTHLIDTRNMHDFMVKNIPKNERRSLINEVSIDEYRFNWTNPTGHWRLNLGMRRQLFVMMKLVSINKVESDFSKDSKQSGRENTSQEGTWFNFRNAKFVTPRGSKNIVIDQDFVDHLPRTGILDFDYVSTTRPGAPHMVEQEFIELLDAPKVPSLDRRQSVLGGDDIVPDVNAKKSGKNNKAPSVLDKYEVISDYEFYSFLESFDLSSRDRVSVSDSLFPLMYLQLAVTKYWFTVKHVMVVMDCFENEFHTQANVTCVFFSRIFDLGNMDILLRSLQKPAQRLILKRLGCLNVLNPLKLALDYKISMLHLDERILLTTMLEISPQEGTDQIREDPKTDVSVLTFYGALHRIVAMERGDNLLFTYLETGVATNVVAWSLRRDALKKFLVGTKPVDRALFRVVGMYREMEKNHTLSRGPIELQYMTHLKIMKKNLRKQSHMVTGQKTIDAMRTALSGTAVVAGGGANAAIALASHKLAEEQEGVTVQPRLIGDMTPGKNTGNTVLEAAHAEAKDHGDGHDSDDDHHGHDDEHIGDDVAGHLDDHDDEHLFGKDEPEEGEEGEGGGEGKEAEGEAAEGKLTIEEEEAEEDSTD